MTRVGAGAGTAPYVAPLARHLRAFAYVPSLATIADFQWLPILAAPSVTTECLVRVVDQPALPNCSQWPLTVAADIHG